MKLCRKCDTTKPLDDFYRDKRAGDGRTTDCKPCRTASNKRWKEANPDKVRDRRRVYLKENADQHREDTRRWRAANPERERELTKARYWADVESSRDKQRAWHLANPEKSAEYSRAYRERNPERAAENTRRYRDANGDRIKELAAAWRAANPDKVTAIDAARRARLIGAVVGDADYEFVKAAYSVCYLCDEPLSGDIHVDHVVPLSRGGAHCTDNLMPTHAVCNRRKHDRLLNELSWYSGPRDLGLSLHPEEL